MELQRWTFGRKQLILPVDRVLARDVCERVDFTFDCRASTAEVMALRPGPTQVRRRPRPDRHIAERSANQQEFADHARHGLARQLSSRR